jgi:hypothetical protein
LEPASITEVGTGTAERVKPTAARRIEFAAAK